MIPLGLTPAASAADAAIQNKTYGLGITTVIIWNEEMKDIIKIVKSLEESVLLTEGVSKAIENEEREQKGIFLDISLYTWY